VKTGNKSINSLREKKPKFYHKKKSGKNRFGALNNLISGSL